MVTIDNLGGGAYESDLNNVNERNRPYVKMTSTLQALHDADSDYSETNFIDTTSGKASYNMDSVKAYLSKLGQATNYQQFVTEVNKGNWGLLNMAVQIALEAKGIEVGKIDGLMGPATKSAIGKFQREYNVSHPTTKIKVDNTVGPQTVRALLEEFGVVVTPPVGGRVTPPEGSEFKETMLTSVEQITYVGGAIPAADKFINGVPVGGTVSLVSTLDNSSVGDQNAQLKIEVGGNEYFKTSKLKVLTPEKYFDQKAKVEKKSVMKDDTAPAATEYVKDMPGGWTASYVLGTPDTSNKGAQNIQIKITTDTGAEFIKTVELTVLE